MSKKTENEKIAQAFKCGFEAALGVLKGAQKTLEPLANELVIAYLKEQKEVSNEG